MGKNKLVRWKEMATFGNVLQPGTEEIKQAEYHLKGTWKERYFCNNNSIVLELGCGKGEYTLGLAVKYPEKNFIGVDIKGARIWRGAKTAIEKNIPNVLFIRTRIEFINAFFDENEVDEIWITFPDPFPKSRDAGRRLTSPSFLNLYRILLKDKGIVHLKTDNSDLFRYTLDTVNGNGLEVIKCTGDLYSGNETDEILSIITHYENIFIKEGKKISYLAFRLEKHNPVKDEN